MSAPISLFVAGLTHLDCAYLDPAHGLVGESWAVDARLSGPLDDTGMICDFGIVKQVIKESLDAEVDHRLILARGTRVDRQTQGAQVELVHADRDGRRLRYRAPAEALCELDLPALDATALADALARLVQPRLPAGVESLTLSLRTESQRGQYHYCHGLQQHAGNCQRMGHGHRGRLGIRLGGLPAPWLESLWVQQLGYRYLGSERHLMTASGVGRCAFAYQSSQGAFELDLPEDRAYVIPASATVECLAAHIADTIAAQHPGEHVEVTAYEGIGKGAVARSAEGGPQ